MVKVIVLFGISGAGKSYWQRFFVAKGLSGVNSVTTRPQRSFGEESDCVQFVTEEMFFDLLKKRDLFNVNKYHDFWYGCLKDDFVWDVESNNNSGKSLVMISDITSLILLEQEFKYRLGVNDDTYIYPFFVECKPREDFEQLLFNRGTPERIIIAKQEMENRKNIKLNIKKIYTISSEQDALDLLKKVK